MRQDVLPKLRQLTARSTAARPGGDCEKAEELRLGRSR
jgi:hypothetical protein